MPEVHPVWEELEADGPQVGIVIPSEADREQIEAACAARDMTQPECDRLWRTALVRANETSIRLVADELQRRRALNGAEMRPSLAGAGDDEAAG